MWKVNSGGVNDQLGIRATVNTHVLYPQLSNQHVANTQLWFQLPAVHLNYAEYIPRESQAKYSTSGE